LSSVSNLFSDQQMQQFIRNGFVSMRVDMPDGFHESIYDRCESIYDSEGNPGNNILPRVPELQQVFDHPTVVGAFDSLLGTDHVMHVHRHGHLTQGKSEDRGWHKDSYWGHKKIRTHHPRWAMVFYYPQTITLENGPTRVCPGSHFYDERFDELAERGQPVLGEAGTIAIVHFDLWHQASANLTGGNRFMMKFQFHRMSEPTAPTWNHENAAWRSQEGDLHDDVWSHHWRWLSGQGSAGPSGNLDELRTQLYSENEPERLNAGYRLGALGEVAVGTLADALIGDDPRARRMAAYGAAIVGEPATLFLRAALDHDDEDVRAHAAFALGDMGCRAESAVPDVAHALKDAAPWVRHHAAEALGTIAGDPDTAVPALAEALSDEDGQVRYTAAYSLACFGTDGAEAVPALAKALHDENRYTSGHAVTALRRIRTPEAIDTLLAWMETTRWCPMTSKESTF
jgi:hypothetical protein